MDDEVEALIARCRATLGDPDGVYRPDPLAGRLVLGSALLLGGLGLCGVVLWFVPRALAAGKFLFAVPFVGGALVYQALATRGRAVLTYPDGLLPVGGGELAWVPWEDLGPVTLRAKDAEPAGDHLAVGPGSVWMPTGKLSAGPDADAPQVVARPALNGFPELAARVQRERFARRWPQVRDTLAAGGLVGFGPFVVSPDLLSHGGKAVEWDRATVTLKGGRILVKRTGRWLSWAAVGLDDVPDAHVFLAAVAFVQAGAAVEETDDEPTF